jgi:hypothetical protein
VLREMMDMGRATVLFPHYFYKIVNLCSLKNMWYLFTMQFYSATKKNEILPFTSKWMEVRSILSEVIQAQKAKIHMFSLIRGL